MLLEKEVSWIPQAPLPMKFWLSCRLTPRHGVQSLAQINVALHQQWKKNSVVESAGFRANDTWLEIHSRAMETFEATMMMFPSACWRNDRSNHLDLIVDVASAVRHPLKNGRAT